VVLDFDLDRLLDFQSRRQNYLNCAFPPKFFGFRMGVLINRHLQALDGGFVENKNPSRSLRDGFYRNVIFMLIMQQPLSP